MLSHVFPPCSLLVFFIHELSPFNECGKATFTSEPHVLLYFVQLLQLNNPNNEEKVLELAKKSASGFYSILLSQSKPLSLFNVFKNMTRKKKILTKNLTESKLTLLVF